MVSQSKRVFSVVLSLSLIQGQMAAAGPRDGGARLQSQTSAPPAPMFIKAPPPVSVQAIAAKGTQAPPMKSVQPQDLVIIPDLRFKPFTFPRTKEQGQTTVNVAEQRPFMAPNMRQDAVPFLGVNGQQDTVDFTNLVRANRLIEIIDTDAEQMEFLSWFFTDKDEHVRDFVDTVKQTVGQMANNTVFWQQFFAAMWVKYNIQTKPPQTALQKLLSQATDVMVMVRSNSVYIIMGMVLMFIVDVARGGLIAGPIAGGMNAFLAKWIVPITQWLTVTGVRLLGPSGERLNAKLFQARVALNFAKNAVFGRTFDLKNKNFSSYLHETAFNAWNSLSRVWDLLPDVLRQGRTHFADHVLFRPADFSQRLSNHIAAAETSLMGADQTRNAIMSRNPDKAREIYDISSQLLLAVGEEMKLQQLAGAIPGVSSEQHPERKSSLSVSQLERMLVERGAFPGEAGSMTERFRRNYAFLRAAAAIVSVEKIHNVQFADLIEVVQGQYTKIRENLFVSFFEPQVQKYSQGIMVSMGLPADLVEVELQRAEKVKPLNPGQMRGGKKDKPLVNKESGQTRSERPRPVEASKAADPRNGEAAKALGENMKWAARNGPGTMLTVIKGTNKAEGPRTGPGGINVPNDPKQTGARSAVGARR